MYTTTCNGKTEIDVATGQIYEPAIISHMTLWEKYTKDSVWTIGSLSMATTLYANQKAFPLKNHGNVISLKTQYISAEVLSYTYRF